MVATTKHPSFQQPLHAGVKVWRYMDLAKFVSLLSSASLFFCRADCLGDPFEGTITPQMLEALMSQSKELEKIKPLDVPPMVDQLRDAYRRGRLSTFVNCWHMNDHESAAMWRLYSLVYLGRVNYIDFSSDAFDPGNLFNPIMHKRISYSHENEVRAVLSTFLAPRDPTAGARGTQIPIALNETIESVYLHPDSRNWLREVVESLLRAFGASMDLVKSDLSIDPVD